METRKIGLNNDMERSAHDEAQAIKMEQTRRRLREDFGVQSMFVRVRTLPKILGLSPATLHTAMRENQFPLPHRVLCSAPLVEADDLVTGLCRSDAKPTDPQSCEIHAAARDFGVFTRRARRRPLAH